LSQIAVQNPASFIIWGAGTYFFLVSPHGRRYRPVGWIFLTLMISALVGGQRRADRIAGVYPVMFAGGAVFLEALRSPRPSRLRRLWNTYTLPAFMVLIGALAATIALPLLPPETLTDHPLFDGTDDWRRQIGKQKLPYHLANRTHWEDLVAVVVDVNDDLVLEDQRDAIILADYFGHAGAFEYYGSDRLPPVYSQHTGYYLWGPPRSSPRVVISIGIDEHLLREYFEDVRQAALFRCEWCPRWQNELPIYLARAPKQPFVDLWSDLGEIGGMDRYWRLLREQDARTDPAGS
jgi:hypothetical protein